MRLYSGSAWLEGVSWHCNLNDKCESRLNGIGLDLVQNTDSEITLSDVELWVILWRWLSVQVYVYVRGRGRGRYVCDRCGIRCKKPSMLNKHIKCVVSIYLISLIYISSAMESVVHLHCWNVKRRWVYQLFYIDLPSINDIDDWLVHTLTNFLYVDCL